MTTFNDPGSRVKEYALSLIAEDRDDNYLEHHGVAGMKWGVRSPETLRKYGLLKGTKVKLSAGATKAKKVLSARGDAISKAASASAKKAKAAAMAELTKKAQAHKAERLEKKAQKAEQNAIRKELGMKSWEFKKLREQTLASHDPRVVAKGAKTLSDKELRDKINRLKAESEVTNIYNQNTQKKWKTRKEAYDAIKAHPAYDILGGAVKSVASSVIVDQLYGQGLAPVLQQKLEYASRNKQMDFADEHPGAFESKETRAQREAINAHNEAETAKAVEKYKAKLQERETQRKEASQRQLEKAFKKSDRQAHEDVKRWREEHNRAVEQRHYDRVKAEGEARNAEREAMRKIERAEAKQARKAEQAAAKQARVEARQTRAAAEIARVNKEIGRFNRENAHFESVRAAGNARNAMRKIEANRDAINRWTAENLNNLQNNGRPKAK